MDEEEKLITIDASATDCVTELIGTDGMTSSLPCIFIDLALTPAPSKVVERGLLAAILWRSFTDLGEHISVRERKAAIGWFRSKVVRACCSKQRFTFHDIVNYLELGSVELKIIWKAVEAAEQIELAREQKLSERLKADTCPISLVATQD